MKVTFKNRLSVVKDYDGRQRIEFDHGQKCQIKMFIEKIKPAKPGEQAHDLDWKITLEGKDGAIVSECKKKLSTAFMTYIKRRTKKPAAKTLYKTMESLAGIRSV